MTTFFAILLALGSALAGGFFGFLFGFSAGQKDEAQAEWRMRGQMMGGTSRSSLRNN